MLALMHAPRLLVVLVVSTAAPAAPLASAEEFAMTRPAGDRQPAVRRASCCGIRCQDTTSGQQGSAAGVHDDALHLVLSVTQPLNFTIDAKGDLRRAIGRMTTQLGFREARETDQHPRPLPPVTRHRGGMSTERRTGDPVGTYTAAGTLPCTAVRVLVANARVPEALLTSRVRDQLVALKARTYGVTLVEVDGQPAPPLATMWIRMHTGSDDTIARLEQSLRARMPTWKVVVFGSHRNPGSYHYQLSLQLDGDACAAVAERVQLEFASQVREAGCT